MEVAVFSKKDQYDFDILVWLADSFKLEVALMFYRETSDA